ncbi:MAG: peptidoglycan-binding protein [Oscillospiraceae bacterium]|nr:peptidoglycan-binding protein [Oscillospiraceae bacterium]
MNLTYGSRGEAVRKLQTALNGAGYGLAVDGIYGTKTQAAVRDYQSKNGLAVDGIAGVLTQGKLYGTAGTAGTAAPKSNISGTSGATEAGLASQYKQSEAAAEAQKRYEAVMHSTAPAAPSDSALQEAYEALQSEPFSYDIEEDPLYAAYRAQYTRLGQTAMEDTLGRAAALTGGYGSSYAQTAAQQAYDGYMQNLGAQLPALYEQAYTRRRDTLEQRYEAAKAQYDAEYARYRDAVEDRRNEEAAARAQLEAERAFGFEEYRTLLDHWLAMAKLEQDDYQWQREYALKAGG